jgi:hypothetical protein
MDEKASEMLAGLAELCRKPALKSPDWDRLYQFAVHVHRHHLHFAARTFRDYLVGHGCSLQKASSLSMQYQHLIKVLHVYDSKEHRT